MQKFTWDSAYEIGDAAIDEQHQRLFDLANELLQADGKSGVTAAAIQLYQYIRVHFRHEEELMRRLSFPRLREHVDQHAQLLDRLNALSADIADDLWRTEDLRSFMNEWLLVHIAQQDIQIAAYMAAPAAVASGH